MAAVCLVTDLHMVPPWTGTQQRLMETRLEVLRDALAHCSLIIYSGDVLTMDSCRASACDSSIELAQQIVESVNRPFMFTLGNHDGSPNGPERWSLRARLNASTLHIGHCDSSLDACVHPTLGIATLYSGKTGCHAETYYGCPTTSSASWIDAALGPSAFVLLVTHIPPPNVLGLRVEGVVRENVCCWDEFVDDDAVLPLRRPQYHAFGHDHSNLFISDPEEGTGVRFLASFKSGWAPGSYDAAFYRGAQGYTILNISEERGYLVDSKTYEGESMSRFYLPGNDALLSQARCCPHTQQLTERPPPPSPAPPSHTPLPLQPAPERLVNDSLDTLGASPSNITASVKLRSNGAATVDAMMLFAVLASLTFVAFAAVLRTRRRASRQQEKSPQMTEVSPCSIEAFSMQGVEITSTTHSALP
jgi:hypothetical protein